jgi:cell fate regulator YaaT (PSP1 superfamily)
MKYISVIFDGNSKEYYFSTRDDSIKIGDKVVVNTTIGLELVTVLSEIDEEKIKRSNLDIAPILRKADKEDLEDYEYNAEDAIKAKEIFEDAVDDLKLKMDLLDCQYTLDRSKILFTYLANERIDFRELLKILASKLHCRIELKQINSRERAQKVGGIGICGLPLCCTTFLTEFSGVSISKAKNQMLTINIPKLSGQCGKLMCCLKYEDDTYTEEKKAFPSLGTHLKYQGKDFSITSYNVISKVLKIENKEDTEYVTLDEVNKCLNKSN